MTSSAPPDDRLRECGDLRNRKTGMSLRTSGIRLLRHRTLRQQGIASYREGYGGPASAGVAGVVRLTRERHAINDARFLACPMKTDGSTFVSTIWPARLDSCTLKGCSVACSIPARTDALTESAGKFSLQIVFVREAAARCRCSLTPDQLVIAFVFRRTGRRGYICSQHSSTGFLVSAGQVQPLL